MRVAYLIITSDNLFNLLFIYEEDILENTFPKNIFTLFQYIYDKEGKVNTGLELKT